MLAKNLVRKDETRTRVHTPHQGIGFGQASRSNRLDLNQRLSSSKGFSLLWAMLVDIVDVDVLAFFCFFLMSFSIQLSVAESPKLKIRWSASGTNVVIYIYLKHTCAFQITTSCNHQFLLRSLILGLINEELKNRFNISTLYNIANSVPYLLFHTLHSHFDKFLIPSRFKIFEFQSRV